MGRIRRILHPSDFSPASRPAFVKAVEMAQDHHAELIVAHVIDPVMPVADESYISPKAYDRIRASARAASQQQLDRLVHRARKAGARAQSLVLEGRAHAEIVRAARSKRVDLVVMGTHGRTGLTKLFLGSVAGRVVSMARCPVMTVRGK